MFTNFTNYIFGSAASSETEEAAAAAAATPEEVRSEEVSAIDEVHHLMLDNSVAFLSPKVV